MPKAKKAETFELKCPHCGRDDRLEYIDRVFIYKPIRKHLESDEEPFYLIGSNSLDTWDDDSWKGLIGCKECQKEFPVPENFWKNADWD